MTTYFARKSGNVNATDVWATTAGGAAGDYFSSFTSSDVLMANSFTVTLNVNATVKEVRNDTTGGATTGGGFTLNSGITLTADIFAGSAACVSHSSGNATITAGTITGGTSGSVYGAVNASSGGTLTVTATTITGGTAVNCYGINFTGSGSVIVTGSFVGGTAGDGIRVNGAGSVTITGTVTGSTAAGYYGCNAQAGTTTIVGTAIGSTSPGVFVAANVTVAVTRAKGGASMSSAAGVAGPTIGSGSVSVEEVEWGDLGASPTSGSVRLTDKTSNVAVMYRFGTTKKTLTDANASGLMPAASNVRYGTVYNGGNSTGTCYVPAASSVAYGVNVDATTGTAALTPAAVWDYLTSSATTSGSMGERLKNAATVASVGQQLADALTTP